MLKWAENYAFAVGFLCFFIADVLYIAECQCVAKMRMLGVFVNNIFEISNTSLSVLKMIV